MAAGSIVIDLLMKTGSFETDTDRAGKALRKLKNDAVNIGKAIGAAFAAVGGATAALVKSSINAADAMAKAAAATGTTTEQLSALGFAAELSGVSQEELNTSLAKLARQAADAANGVGAASDVFKALGVSVKGTDGALKTTDQLLTEVADKFASYEDGAAKTALAQELFGRSGAKLIPLLNQGAAGLDELKREAEALGLVIGGDTAAQAEAFNDSLTRINAVRRGLVNGIARELLPTLNNLSAQLLDSAKSSGLLDAAARSAATGVRILLSGGALLLGVFKTIGEGIGGLAASLVALFSGRFQDAFNIAKDTVIDFGGNLRSTASAVASVWDTTASEIESKAPALGGKIAAPIVAARAVAERAGKAVADAATKAYEAVERQIAAISREISVFGQDQTAVQLFDLQAAGADPEQIARAKELLATLQQLREERSESERITAQQVAVERELAQIYDATRTPLERLNAELARLAELRNVAGADLDALARAEFDAWDRYTTKIEDATKELDKFAQNAAASLQSFLGDQLAQAFEGNFKDIGRGFTRLIQRMAAEWLAASFVRGLAAGFAAPSGGFLSAFAGAFRGGKAGGGDVMANQSYIVGERGPEMFVPRTAGTIIPNSQMGQSGPVYSPTINVNGDVSQQTIDAMRTEIARDRARWMRQMQYRGTMA